MKQRFVAVAVAAAVAVGLAISVRAQNVTPESLGSAGLILAGQGAGRRAVGIGFFIEVPSERFNGSSFVYLVTAKHNLLDAARRPLNDLSFALAQGKAGSAAVKPLPSVNEWVFYPKDPKVDLAVLPYSPLGANYTTVPVSHLIDTSASDGAATGFQLGADAYYVSLLSESPASAPIMTIHFGRVSVADSVAAEVESVGPQRLNFLEGLSVAQLSGSPVFVRIGDSIWLWGLVEARAAIAMSEDHSGLIGVLPATPIAQTVRAMAAAQDRHSSR